jgi:hypothetical protein
MHSCFRYHKFADLAKNGLRFVRLDDMHPQVLEWLVKFPSMPLTFESFKRGLIDKHMELVQLFQ